MYEGFPGKSMFRAVLPGLLALAPGCAGGTVGPGPEPAPRPLFVERGRELGLDFVHRLGPEPTYFMPEIMGAGVALFDADGDGDLDVYLVNGAAPPGLAVGSDPPRNRLFRHEADGSFTDVTAASGLGDPGFGMGVAVGDFDDDARPDVYVTNFGPNQLYRNRGDGSFERVTERAGVGDPGWGASAAFLDYDADGRLDLFVANYIELDPGTACHDPTGAPAYCDVGRFRGQTDRLFHNDGGGRFSDVTDPSGIGRVVRHGLGVVATDLDGDGRIDIYVANDMDPNDLWINRGDGTFEERAVLAGAAFDAAGHAEAGMGLVCADLDGDGDLDLLSTHFHGESHTLYRNLGAGSFADGTADAGLLAASMAQTGFGAAAIDVEHDGDLDLVVANGHVYRVGPAPGSRVAPFWADYADTGSLFLSDGARFTDASQAAGEFGNDPQVGRGLAAGDLDGDGDLDFVTTSCSGPARLFFNESEKAGHWLIVRARVGPGRRDAEGAQVTVTAGGRRRVALAARASSYLSSGDPRAHFGLGGVEHVDAIEVLWPDGTRERFAGGAADREVEVVRGGGS